MKTELKFGNRNRFEFEAVSTGETSSNRCGSSPLLSGVTNQGCKLFFLIYIGPLLFACACANFVTWVPARDGNHPKYAVHAGIDKGKKLYVCRARYNNGVIPGKLHSGHKVAYISLNTVEVSLNEYEVLVAPPATLSWVDALEYGIPQFAIPGGHDPSGETYYIGRVFHQGTVTIGKVQPSHGCCYVPYGGLEFMYTDYEILVKNKLGRAMNV